MRGKDFTEFKFFLSDEATNYLETKGADSFIVHNCLSKMYFESIWNLNGIKQRLAFDGGQLGVTKEDCLNLYYQMLFDIVSFYDIGNANKFYSMLHGKWFFAELFSNNHTYNNQFLSATMYVYYFLDFIKNLDDIGSEVRHILFMNAVMLVECDIEKDKFLKFLNTLIDNKDKIEEFYWYSIEVSKAFFTGTIVSAEKFVSYIVGEAQYCLARNHEQFAVYQRYMKHTGIIIRECELCANRQNNYGLTEMEFEDVLEAVI